MKIAIIGGGASGMVTAYLLDRQGHEVTVFEREAVLGGHIRTLNQNVQPNHSTCDRILENGVLEFPTAFHTFLQLMHELEVELEPVEVGSALFLQDGRHFLSGGMIRKNFRSIQRWIEYLRIDTLYARSAGFWVTTQFSPLHDFHHQSTAHYLGQPCIRNCWLKLLAMYSYSMPFDLIDHTPADLVLPALRDYVFVNWVRIKGGVYSYIQKICDRFHGTIHLQAQILAVARTPAGVRIVRSQADPQLFDKVVFATPPDQVLHLLADPSPAEMQRFAAWQANYATTILHRETAMYDRYGVQFGSEFDFFQTATGWGYNAYLNQLCGLSDEAPYGLAFNLDSLIAPDKILHIQTHHTPLYTVAAFRYRDEVIRTNGDHNTYHVGAYLGDGLHEGAIASAMRVADLIGG